MATAHSQRLAGIYSAGQLQAAKDQNIQGLNQGYGRAEDFLNDNASSALGAVSTGQTSALQTLGSGYDAAKQSYSDASAMYQPWATAGTQALTAYENGIGLNGAAGNDAATAAFRASPGYQYQVDQATDAVARKASALGVLGSGNTMTAISDRAQNLADQDYGSYLDRLSGLSTQGLQATGAQANLTKGIGDLSAQQGTTAANLTNTDALATAGIYTGLGSGLASTEAQHANQVANTVMQAATGQANAVTSAAQASDAANNANDNLALGLLGLGVKAGTSIYGAKG